MVVTVLYVVVSSIPEHWPWFHIWGFLTYVQGLYAVFPLPVLPGHPLCPGTQANVTLLDVDSLIRFSRYCKLVASCFCDFQQVLILLDYWRRWSRWIFSFFVLSPYVSKMHVLITYSSAWYPATNVHREMQISLLGLVPCIPAPTPSFLFDSYMNQFR